MKSPADVSAGLEFTTELESRTCEAKELSEPSLESFEIVLAYELSHCSRAVKAKHQDVLLPLARPRPKGDRFVIDPENTVDAENRRRRSSAEERWQPVLALNPWAERPLPDALRTMNRFEADNGRWIFREGSPRITAWFKGLAPGQVPYSLPIPKILIVIQWQLYAPPNWPPRRCKRVLTHP